MYAIRSYYESKGGLIACQGVDITEPVVWCDADVADMPAEVVEGADGICHRNNFV